MDRPIGVEGGVADRRATPVGPGGQGRDLPGGPESVGRRWPRRRPSGGRWRRWPPPARRRSAPGGWRRGRLPDRAIADRISAMADSRRAARSGSVARTRTPAGPRRRPSSASIPAAASARPAGPAARASSAASTSAASARASGGAMDDRRRRTATTPHMVERLGDATATGCPATPPIIRLIEILVVCTGNTCRSPMAAALLGRRLDEAGVKAVVSSAGPLFDGKPATDSRAGGDGRPGNRHVRAPLPEASGRKC